LHRQFFNHAIDEAGGFRLLDERVDVGETSAIDDLITNPRQ
jgi:hypothetical protein